ncbi:hypothetical protein niasHT_008449 [Heterodera trifolii]|uniref:Uncharacterized protein n=1 Tax=Heterodera trifolii TaxID=157864 RepID=A0ABD2MCH7_9BILA
MFMDQIPRRVTMGLVANTDYVGTLLRSPFNFQPFNVREISITANGRPYPQAPYDLDYSNGKYVRPFNDMNEAVGFANSTESNGITFAQYGKTHCIYVFNLTNSGDDQAALFDLIKNGTTAVSIKFNQPVPAGGIMLVVMGECDSLVILSLILFFLRISLPCVSSTLREQQQQRQPENTYSAYLKNLTLTRQQHEPEYTYTEYLRRLSLSKRSTTIPITTTPKTPPKSDKLIDEHVSAVLPPLIQLCKDKPEESSFFHQAVCWALFALYLMLIISLVLHQLCSIFCENRRTGRVFQGCFASDKLPPPSTLQYPAALVVNRDPHHKEGSHWCAIYAKGLDAPVLYFDSLAQPIPSSDYNNIFV